ncbi:hypothetical protein G6M16_008670 [Agrobacterium tumefaciens]|nr:hypothetical protein G6M16_008670 [Agrobacterium tumefaciens]
MTIRMRVLPRFPAKISGSTGIKITRPDGSTDLTVSLDVSDIVRVPSVADNNKVFFIAWNSDQDTYSIMSFADTFAAVIDTEGFMLQSMYDPQGIEDDAFDRANHTGEQAISTVTGLQTALNNLDSADTALAASIIVAGTGLLNGLTLSNNATDATNDIDFAAGVCASESGVAAIMSHSAGTAQLDVAFGSGNGGRFDSAISDGWWHCFVISNGTTVSRGFSKSLNPTSQPSYPSGYTRYRRVGSILRASGVINQFKQNGDYFNYTTPALDRSSTVAASNVLLTLTVPTGVKVSPIITSLLAGGGAGALCAVAFGDGDMAAATITIQQENGTDVSRAVLPGGACFTNTAGQLRLLLTVSGTNPSFCTQSTTGYLDPRGRY